MLLYFTLLQGRFRCIAKNAAGQAVSECTLTVKTAAKPAAEQAVVPAGQPPRDVTHTIQMEDVQRDTLEVEEQKTISDREVARVFIARRHGTPIDKLYSPQVVVTANTTKYTIENHLTKKRKKNKHTDKWHVLI